MLNKKLGNLTRFKFIELLFVAYILCIPFFIIITKFTLNRYPLYILYLIPLVLTFFIFMIMPSSYKVIQHISNFYLLFLLFLLLQIFNPLNHSILMGFSYYVANYSPALVVLIFLLYFYEPKKIVRLIKYIWITALLGAIYSLYQAFIGYPAFEDRWAFNLGGGVHGLNVWQHIARRPPGFTLYSATNAQFLGGCFLIRFSLYEKINKIDLICLVIILLSFLTTQTRGIWIAVIFGFIYILFCKFQKNSLIKFAKKYAIFILLCFIITLLSFAYIDFLYQRLISFHNSLTIASHPLMSRILMWISYLSYSKDTLWSGLGTGSIGIGGGLINLSAGFAIVADNMYLNILLSTGFIGLFLFVSLLLSAVIDGHRLTKTLTDNAANLNIGAVSVIIMNSISFITGDYLQAFPGNLVFWIAFGIIYNGRMHMSNYNKFERKKAI
ncbi:MAG: O-antigen ligase family protein [Desulfamplus sp.]|nr:O-antigen ligase family protein [Desulfamplus sp.]